MSQTEQFRKLCAWLCLPTPREQRLYLETHLDLLVHDNEQRLEILIAQQADHPTEQQRLRIQRRIFFDARERGGTLEAVREAYINEHGGLILDLQPWLVEVEQLLGALCPIGQTERMRVVAKVVLKEAIAGLQDDSSSTPEILAELRYHLGRIFSRDSPERSYHPMAMAIDAYEAALQVYSRHRYPLQHRKVLIALGDAYRSYQNEKQREYLERAIRCYQAALH